MNQMTISRKALCLLLTVLLLVGMLPAQVLAAKENSFVLVAEAGGKLVIPPEYITYVEGQTVQQALAASGHTFTGLDSGMVSEINGVVGNFTRSDEDGDFALDKSASEVEFFRFSEAANSQPSAGLQALMTAMAEYLCKGEDTRNAVKSAYQTACEQFVDLSSESAQVLADNLNDAIREYEESQNGDQFSVTFLDGEAVYSAVSIRVENAYGKCWEDDGDGVLTLPKGIYTFSISKDGLFVSGSITVNEAMTVVAPLPRQLWLRRDTFRLSGSYGAEGGENQFTDEEFTPGSWNERQVTVPVPDTFSGTVYSYAQYDTDALGKLPKLTAIYQSAQSGEQRQQEIPFESLTSGASGVLKRGAAGNSVTYRLSNTGKDGFTYSQDYTVIFDRIPTLTKITVKDQNGVDQTATAAFDGNVTDYTYKVLNTITSVTVQAEPLDSSYSVNIDEKQMDQGVTVSITQGEQTQIPVVVSANGYSNTYTLTIIPGEGKALSFLTSANDVTLEVVNSNGEIMPFEKFKEGSSGNRYQYTLVPGETYSYVATANTYYHVADTFTMEDAADSTIQVDVPTEDWLKALSLGVGGTAAKYKDTLKLDTAFDPTVHSYATQLVDTEHLAYVWVAANTTAEITAVYDQIFASSLYHGKENTVELISGSKTGKQLNRFLMDENPIENTACIRLAKESNGVTCYQDYEIAFKRQLTLKEITADCDDVTTVLHQPDGTIGFDPAVKEYTATVSMAAKKLKLYLTPPAGRTCYGEERIGYIMKADGVDATENGTVQIELDGTLQTQTMTITVENEKAPEGVATYTLNILKSPPVQTSFAIQPEDALLAVYETLSGQRFWPEEDGTYQFCEGYSYRYALTAYGYVSKTGTLSVTRDEKNALIITDGTVRYPVSETAEGGALTISMILDKAAENTKINKEMTAYWPDFRGSDTNNSVVGAPIPTSAEAGTLYWANQIGSGIDADAVGSPIIVDGDLITYAGDKLYRVDTVTGQIKATGTMDHKSSFSITPPVFAEGMVFVALSNGTVQAFNADTLESLWVYNDMLGGQPNCPLTVRNGRVYTGFWVSETSDANFVCLTITDEDPNQQKESKCAAWNYTAKGGYYWAGAYVSDEFVLVGTDDGTNGCTGQSSRMLLLNAKTGEILDSWNELNGDVRSTVVYDAVTDAYYFTSKGGSFYCVKVTKTESGWKLADKWSVDLENGVSGVPMSTSSPVVYNGRAYVGVSGSGQFSAYSGHNITVIDLVKQTIAYTVGTQGYPQTSGLLTTAYEKDSGYVYIYFFDNMTPGKLRVLRDKRGQTKADYVTTEGQYSSAYALFTPTGDHAQYAICSPIVDEYGTIYFKNDSAHLMAFGSTVEKIEVTKLPDKTLYRDGEVFQSAGVKVTATYTNGMTRDVTDYVTFSQEPITVENPMVTISFPHVMYHNVEDGTKMTTGVVTTTPTVTLELEINDAPVLHGDVNLDNAIDKSDALLLVAWCYGDESLSIDQLAAADVNGDGQVDIRDANRIVSHVNGIFDITTNRE